MSKEGSTVSGLMDAFARAISYALQYGVPLEVLVDKFSHTRFEPSGFTGNSEIPYAKSITDYIFRWLALKFLTPEQRLAAGVAPETTVKPEPAHTGSAEKTNEGDEAGARDRLAVPGSVGRTTQVPISAPRLHEDAPSCSVCGSIMVRNGSCYKCLNCGTTSGCS
jgi:ribonucleoside-diphosphate reductase alpha chain